MRRFVAEAVVYTLVATALWYVGFKTDVARQSTLEFARILHRVAGCPAPYMVAEVKPYVWHAPLFPPLVGLMLASSWLSWRRRLGFLAVGLGCFWLMVAVQIVLVYSPYLPLSMFRSFVERIYVSSGYLAAPIILWLLLSGGPLWLVPGEGDRSERREHPLFGRRWHAVAAALVLCVLFTLPVFIAAGWGAPAWSEHRGDMAAGIRKGDAAAALVALQEILPDDPRNDGLIYLAARLHQQRGETKDARALARVVFQRRHMLEYMNKEFGPPTAAPNSTSKP